MTSVPVPELSELAESTGAPALTRVPFVFELSELSEESTGVPALTSVPFALPPPLPTVPGVAPVAGVVVSTGAVAVATVPVGDVVPVLAIGAVVATGVVPLDPEDPVELTPVWGVDPGTAVVLA